MDQHLTEGLKILKHADYYFTPDIESEYQLFHNKQSLFSRRGGLILGLVVFNLFLILDYLLIPQYLLYSILIRVLIVSPIFCLGIVATYTKKHLNNLEYITGLVLCAALGANLALDHIGFPHTNHYYVGLILLLTYGVIFFRIQLKLTIIISAFVFLAYEIISISRHNLSPESVNILNNSLFVFSASFLTPFVAFFMDKYSRIIFIQQSKIEHAMALETELRKAERLDAIGTMIGGISHEFNNALQSLFLYAGMAKERLPEDKFLNEDFDNLLKSANDAKHLVEQVMLINSLDSGDKQLVNLPEIIAETINLKFAHNIPGVTIELHLENSCPEILGDKNQIQQALEKVLDNALLAMENGGVLKVHLDY